MLKLLFTGMKFEILYLGSNKQAKKRYDSRRARYFTMYAPLALTLFLGGKCFLHVLEAENVDFSFKIQNTVFLILSQYKARFCGMKFKMDRKKCDFCISFCLHKCK